MVASRADHFLRLIRRTQRGRLKIYLGYAAGVGKTYQMLLEGHRMKDDGIDLVVGIVETHGRAETVALVAGLELVPRHQVSYHGIVIEEMDLNAILARRPAVVLVDELAHTNVPGSKHDKRYQDVEELLAAGIHVISTLNIQHVESLYETVERATSVKVRERIPDRVVAEADQLVNVDLTIEDLRRRLQDGKVYTKERIQTALDHFFKPANLEQLRELTLRELASQIDSRRRGPQSEDNPSSPDQIMVCLSSRGPNSKALLRYASRLAGRLNRNWYAVYVQTSQEQPTLIDATTQRILSNTLALAQQLGATVFTYKGDDAVKTILQFAKEYLVGHIVIGPPGRKVPFWRRLLGEQSIVERLITEGTGITLVVPDTGTLHEEPAHEEKRTLHAATSKGAQPRPMTPEPQLPTHTMIALVWDQEIDKEEALRLMLESFTSLNGEVKQAAWESVLEREKLGGTFVGDDMCIPHARVENLATPLVAIGIGRVGIREKESGRLIRIMALLLSPPAPPERHLEMLSLISKMARNQRWRQTIVEANDACVAMQIIQDWRESETHRSQMNIQ